MPPISFTSFSRPISLSFGSHVQNVSSHVQNDAHVHVCTFVEIHAMHLYTCTLDARSSSIFSHPFDYALLRPRWLLLLVIVNTKLLAYWHSGNNGKICRIRDIYTHRVSCGTSCICIYNDVMVKYSCKKCFKHLYIKIYV